MIHLLYNLVLLPVIFPYLAWRLLVRGKSRAGLAERFGRVPSLGPPLAGGRVWVHAVSMGETVAAVPVVAALRQALPDAEIIVSTTTPTGQEQARRALPDAALHFYFPIDLPWVVRRVLYRLRPSALVLVEAEVWPNLLEAARRHGLPVVVANGHISDRTFRRARRLRRLLAPVLAGIARYLAQSSAIRDRAEALGLPPERVLVAGHTKFDQVVPALEPEEVAGLRAGFGLESHQPLFLAGSTHEGEEEQILDAWQAARRSHPDLALMLAPRHLDRVPAVRTLIEQRGLSVRTRSEMKSGVRSQVLGVRTGPNTQHPTPNTSPVLLLDTMGELARFYALAAVAFVGGSLVPKGGHDILQPLFHGVPTLFGPHVHNQRQLAALTLQAGAARQVQDSGSLAETLVALLTGEQERDAMMAAAGRLMTENQGASARCASVVAALIRGESGGDGQETGEEIPNTGPGKSTVGSRLSAGAHPVHPC
jgi:3-deoxy-D-manno-octulosonic-acid transferase